MQKGQRRSRLQWHLDTAMIAFENGNSAISAVKLEMWRESMELETSRHFNPGLRH